MLTSDVLQGHARRQRRRFRSLHHLACTWRLFSLEGCWSDVCTRFYYVHMQVLWQCYFCASCPAGQNDDAFMHKSNEQHEAELPVASGDNYGEVCTGQENCFFCLQLRWFGEQVVALKCAL